jgi:hypothetical protein
MDEIGECLTEDVVERIIRELGSEADRVACRKLSEYEIDLNAETLAEMVKRPVVEDELTCFNTDLSVLEDSFETFSFMTEWEDDEP